jgi:hypothetical protein
MHQLAARRASIFACAGVTLAIAGANAVVVGRHHCRWLVDDEFLSAVFSVDGCLVLSTSPGEETVKIWNSTSGENIHTLAHDKVKFAIFSPDGSSVLTESRFETKRWSTSSGEMIYNQCGPYLAATGRLAITLLFNRAGALDPCSDSSELEMLEKILLDGDSGACLEQQEHVQEAILRSKETTKLQSLTHANNTSGVSSNEASSSGESVSGQTSMISAAGSKPNCYVRGTCFLTMNGDRKAIEDIKATEHLVSADGSAVEVKSNTPYPSMDREMVLLETSSLKIALTCNHRVVILRGGSLQTIPAGHLRVGDMVQSRSGEKKLISAEHFFGDMEVYEMVLEPDVPIETFFIAKGPEENAQTASKGTESEVTSEVARPVATAAVDLVAAAREDEAILTKGKRATPRNRGYIRKR